MILEAFPVLLRDPGHWEFELFLILIFDVLIGMLAWPFIKRHIHKDVGEVQKDENRILTSLEKAVKLLDELTQRVAVLEGDPDAITREYIEGRKSANWARVRLGYPAFGSSEEFRRQYEGRFPDHEAEAFFDSPWPEAEAINHPVQGSPPDRRYAESITDVGQDWCDNFEPGPDGVHCITCEYPQVGHGQHGDEESYQEHRLTCALCAGWINRVIRVSQRNAEARARRET